MKITKYEHSCLDINIDNKRLLVDPGILSKSIPSLVNIFAIIVTHVHPDHFDLEIIKSIYLKNPKLKFYTVQAVSDVIGNKIPHEVVTGGKIKVAGPFKLEFAGGIHATIYKSHPPTDNVGVIINDSFYYPGDSLSKPTKKIDILGAPISAPWLKISEIMDFIVEQQPKRVFQVHDGLLSDFGYIVYEAWLKDACKMVKSEFSHLDVGQSLNI